MGDTNRLFDGADRLLEYGIKNVNNRSNVFGHFIKAFGHWAAGNMKAAQKSSKTAIEVALDPFYAQFPKVTLGITYFFGGQIQEAENVLQSGIKFCEKRALDELSVTYQYFLGPILIAKGHMQQGADLLENAQKSLIRNQRRVQYAMSEYVLGEVNSQIATGPKPSLSILAKNIGYLIKNVPFASKKAERNFSKAIKLFKKFGMKNFLGQCYLSLGRLYKESNRSDKAKQSIVKSIDCFQECGAEDWLKQANEVLDSLV